MLSIQRYNNIKHNYLVLTQSGGYLFLNDDIADYILQRHDYKRFYEIVSGTILKLNDDDIIFIADVLLQIKLLSSEQKKYLRSCIKEKQISQIKTMFGLTQIVDYFKNKLMTKDEIILFKTMGEKYQENTRMLDISTYLNI